MASINCYFIAIFTILLTLRYISSCVSCIVSVMGSAIIISALSWKIAKCVHSHYSRKNPISSFQKAVLITGCDTGFGNRLALKLNECGFVVYATVLDTESDGSMDLKKNCVFPKSMNVIKMDVTNDEEVAKTYNYVSEHLKKESIELWGLINNAGIGFTANIEWSTLDKYHRVFDVNVFGVVRVTRVFLPLIRQSKGRIVNIASILAKLSAPIASHYSMSKHALLSFTDALRRELHGCDVNVSAILPGLFGTNLINCDRLTKEFDNAWNTTNESVRQSHGHEYYESTKRDLINELNRNNKHTNIDLVVNTIIDSLTNNSPQITYMVVEDWLTTIVMFLNAVLPTECIDKLILLKSYLLKNKLFQHYFV